MTRKEAKAAGLTRYSTGKPCFAGHISERQVSDCRCTECARIYQSIYAKYADKNTNARHRAYEKAHPEKKREWRKKWMAKNIVAFRAKRAAYMRARRAKGLSRDTRVGEKRRVAVPI